MIDNFSLVINGEWGMKLLLPRSGIRRQPPFLFPFPYCLLPLLRYLSIASPNAAKAFTRSFRSGHLAMDFSVNRPSAGSSVARHSWAMRAQVAS